jgi:hypothetical protein
MLRIFSILHHLVWRFSSPLLTGRQPSIAVMKSRNARAHSGRACGTSATISAAPEQTPPPSTFDLDNNQNVRSAIGISPSNTR